MANLFEAKPTDPPATASPSNPPMATTGLTLPMARPQHQKRAAALMTVQPAEGASPVFLGAPGAAGAKARFTLATLLQECSADDLGFNPACVPAWLSTSVEVKLLHEQASAGAYALNLGALLDGVADQGFRNMLSGAKRDVLVQIPSNDVFHALTATQDCGASAKAPALANITTPAPSMAMPKMMVSPPNSAPPIEPPALLPAAASLMFAASAAPITFTPFGNPGATTTGILNLTPPAAASPIFAQSPATVPSLVPPPAPQDSLFACQPPPTEEPAQTFASASAPAQFSMALEAPKSAFSTLATSVQPLAGAFNAFGTLPAEAAPAASRPIHSAVKAFDPLAPSAAAGLSSEQLLGVIPAAPISFAASSLFRPAPPTQPLIDPFASQREAKTATAESVIPLISDDPKPSAFFGASVGAASENVPTTPMLAPAMVPSPGQISNPFTAPQEAPPAPSLKLPPVPFQAPAPASAATPAPAALASISFSPQPKAAPPTKASFLGLTALDTDTDQLLLRALLGVEATLDASRVVELLATLPGLSACICINGTSVLSYANPSAPEDATFQQQAPDIARQLRGLAPLIGIEGAETFTLNAGGRLLTFCFPGQVSVGVLHQGEPGTGLRDKITLVARELARLLR